MPRDDDPRPEQGGSPAGPGPRDWEHVVIPDDPRELDAEVRAYRRDQRAANRGRRLRRIFVFGRYGAVGPIALALAALVLVVSSAVWMFPQPRSEIATPDQLAEPNRPDGAEGGLVPDIEVGRAGGGTAPLRTLRPGVLVLLPDTCECPQDIRDVAEAAQRYRLLTVLIGRSVPGHPEGVARDHVLRLADADGTLMERYEVQTGPVLVLVQADGTIHRVMDEVPNASTLSAALIKLAEPADE